MIKEWHLKSSNYHRQLLLLGLFTSLSLIIVYWFNGYKFLGILFIIGTCLIYLWGAKNPYIRHLENRAGRWIVSYSNGKQMDGESLSILWSNRYGMTLRLKNSSRKFYYIVIFADQFSYADEHQLRWQLFNIRN